MVEGVAIGLEGNDGEGVKGVGTDGFELHAKGGVHALHLDIDQVGFGWGLPAETPKGGGHFEDEGFFDWVGGFPSVEMGVHEELELGKFFTREDEFLDVGGVGNGVEGRAAFAFGGLGACGFERVEARSEFAFVVCSHCDYRIADELKDTMLKCFRIFAKWVVTLEFEKWKTSLFEK